MRVEAGRGAMGEDRDKFPDGMRVLAVDDDPTCLKVLEALLRQCKYHVTTSISAIMALKMLRENKDKFDLIITDVHMPDMDGFKLLELVGLDMDLPVIMLSANGDTEAVMKGITHGACDYLLKPVRMEELKHIWQHVIRRKKFAPIQSENSDNGYPDVGQGPANSGSSEKVNRMRKDQNEEEEDDSEENMNENENSNTQKKARVAWSIELHRKFVAAVNHLGLDKAVPKRILDLMNVEGLSRENVASHLQKYRLYLKKLARQNTNLALFGVRDPYRPLAAHDNLVSGSSVKVNRKRKDQNEEEEDDSEENTNENENSNTQKKARVVWSIELHRKFVAAVNHLGVDKAVPKRILDLMNVEGLSNENVASHLQKFKLYLKRLASQNTNLALLGGRDPCLLLAAHDNLKDETLYAGVLNLMEPTSEYKAGSSIAPTASLFSEARFSLCRDDVTKNVNEFLFTDDCMDHNISVIRIFGIGGVGKTTLVKRVYDESTPRAIFEARAWVCVNERLDIDGLAKEILESLTGIACGLTELKLVQEAVREELMGKRFLLVLDNVLDDAPSFWSSLLVPLSVGAKGSIIIATARSEKESVMDTTLHYKLDRLSENECWLVFQQQVFDRKGQKVCSNLMDIGKQIITRCEGLPLAVKAFGGLLQSDLNERSWNAVLESNLWDEDGNVPALKVCCDHLTVHLQRCFQYCSLFPKGYMFDKDHMIRLWMSEGFIEHEDTGYQYFNEMLVMSFFQHCPNLDPTENKYMMHDLFHDIAQSLSVIKCLRAGTCKLTSIPDAVCHVSLVPSKFDTTLQFASLKELRDIHTLLLINSSIMKWEANIFHVEDPASLNDLFSRLGCLRTLDLSFTDIEEVPESIGNLQNLCYLALNRTNIRKLPESICSLYNLRTLELHGCNYLSDLPAQLKNLTNLQYLDVWKESGFISMPPGIGQLIGLQTLSTFTVGRGELWCGVRELKDLMNLRGALCIGGLWNVVSGEEAEVAELKTKEHLKTLTLQWFTCGEDLEDDQSAETASEVLQSLQPHYNLEELTIRDYSGDQFPSWIADPSFLKLMSITLDNCYECNNLPLLSQLPSLKHLSVRMMDGIQRLGHEFCGSGPSRGFQSLETLKLWDMPELIEWSGVEEEYFPCLHNLSISRCNRLRGLPCFPSLLELSIHYCAQLRDLPTLPCLKSLKIDGLQILPFPQLNLPALEILEISNCNQLLLEDSLDHLPSLKQLKVNRCPELNFSPSNKLPSTLQVVEICGSCALLSSWYPDGFDEITDAHQARRKFVRCKATTRQGNSVDDFNTCQVVDSEMLSF